MPDTTPAVLDHIIVRVTDGPFLPVRTGKDVTLDYMTVDPSAIGGQHLAFGVTEEQFDRVLAGTDPRSGTDLLRRPVRRFARADQPRTRRPRPLLPRPRWQQPGGTDRDRQQGRRDLESLMALPGVRSTGGGALSHVDALRRRTGTHAIDAWPDPRAAPSAPARSHVRRRATRTGRRHSGTLPRNARFGAAIPPSWDPFVATSTHEETSVPHVRFTGRYRGPARRTRGPPGLLQRQAARRPTVEEPADLMVVTGSDPRGQRASQSG